MKSSSRNSVIVLLALLLGLAAAGSAYVYLKGVETTSRPPTAVPVATVDVVVAAADIPAGAKIPQEALKTQTLPAAAKHPNAIDDPAVAVGKIATMQITAGEQILTNKITDQPEATPTPELDRSRLSNLIPSGYRAVSIVFGEVIGAGALVRPGDRVDVIATFKKETMGKDEALTILQNVEILALSQTTQTDLEPTPTEQPQVQRPLSGLPIVGGAGGTPVPTPRGGASPVNAVRPTATPQPKTATIAVTPEQAQRLALAEENGKLRLALRRAGDTTISDLVEAQLSTIKGQLEPEAAQITGVSISPTTLKAGDTLTVKITVKNTSNKPLQSQEPKPEYAYVQGQTYHSQGFASQAGKWRVGLNLAGPTPVEFPYRWGWVGDLAPGASTTITGFIKITSDFKPTNFWAGLIVEPAKVVQDSVGTTLVQAFAENMAVVTVDVANVRSGPGVSSGVIAQVPYGTQLEILGQSADWYKVKLQDQREGWVAAGWIVTAAR